VELSKQTTAALVGVKLGEQTAATGFCLRKQTETRDDESASERLQHTTIHEHSSQKVIVRGLTPGKHSRNFDRTSP
jgi:hypothetical protein